MDTPDYINAKNALLLAAFHVSPTVAAQRGFVAAVHRLEATHRGTAAYARNALVLAHLCRLIAAGVTADDWPQPRDAARMDDGR